MIGNGEGENGIRKTGSKMKGTGEVESAWRDVSVDRGDNEEYRRERNRSEVRKVREGGVRKITGTVIVHGWECVRSGDSEREGYKGK